MQLTTEFQSIRDWAANKGIYEKGDPLTQYAKLIEEVGELAKSLLTKDEAEFQDAIGDCTVVLTNLAKLKGYNIEDCINGSYAVIAKRKGQMINGTFVKESDLSKTSEQIYEDAKTNGTSIDAVELATTILREEIEKQLQNE
jgi:NTP pyrophosphatase (non-canonical NTP hydrolase)